MSDQVPAQIVKVFGTKVWIESDFAGARHVMVQHDDGESKPFTYASFHYDWRYTSNSSTKQLAEKVAEMLGATAPIEHKTRLPQKESP